ncbi:AP-1 complex-associated regulatory protein-like isoform X2 [Scleropages formosus]|uniref:AP-1 complex-associated regulatory protein-like isoform X2 n=1 Tax=Scleropages formosus TaxID=113540 RepID=UPI000878BC57|nr:AP-1 complex-associated regulatory protein-like isoform X2 [Scleropages formosus]
MGNCWVLCAGLIRRGTGRIQKGGGSKYFRSRNAGGHYTIEFENLVESDEEEIPQNCPRAISEEELGHLRAQQYTAISDKQTLIDERLQAELAEQEEKLRLEEEAQCAAQREAARLARARRQQEQEQREKIDTDISSQRGHQNAMMMESNPGAQLQSMKGQEEVMRSRRLPSDMATVMPKVKNNSEFTSQTSSTNNEDLDLEWDSEDGLSRALPDQDNSGTEDTQQALVVQPGDHLDGRPASTALEWENDFVSAHGEDSADSEYDGFVNPVLDSTSSEPSSRSTTDQQDR